MSQAEHQASTYKYMYPSFCSMKQLGVFLLFPEWDGNPTKLPLSINFAGTHLYTKVDRGTKSVKCHAQEHNAMFPVRAPTQTP